MEKEREARIPMACSLEAGGPWLPQPRGSVPQVYFLRSSAESRLSRAQIGDVQSKRAPAGQDRQLDPHRPEDP